MTTDTIQFDSPRDVERALAHEFGNLRTVEQLLEVKVTSREGWVRVEGQEDGVARARELFEDLRTASARGVTIRQDEFNRALENVLNREGMPLATLFSERIEVGGRCRAVAPRTAGQRRYVLAMRQSDIVFGLGPAGTGKTYLAMAMAVEALRRRKVGRIMLTRPAVEAGESLGFLPGDLYEKVLPYLRPLYDALYDMMEVDEIQRNMDRGVIEVAPLAYMRGRTLNYSFVILDEAQNTTPEQMLMFLTRLGHDSRCVVTGDPSQTDLPPTKRSGLADAEKVLQAIAGIEFIRFGPEDVVRHELVQRIIRAYEQARGNGAEPPAAGASDPAPRSEPRGEPSSDGPVAVSA